MHDRPRLETALWNICGTTTCHPMVNQLLNLSHVNLSTGSFMPHSTALNKIVFSIIKDIRILVLQ